MAWFSPLPPPPVLLSVLSYCFLFKQLLKIGIFSLFNHFCFFESEDLQNELLHNIFFKMLSKLSSNAHKSSIVGVLKYTHWLARLQPNDALFHPGLSLEITGAEAQQGQRAQLSTPSQQGRTQGIQNLSWRSTKMMKEQPARPLLGGRCALCLAYQLARALPAQTRHWGEVGCQGKAEDNKITLDLFL